jgi:glycerol-3-phosphate dehydrogenase
VRPLLDDESGDPSAVTRDYQLELDTESAPLLTVWGGKITTFRKLAEEAADMLAPSLPEPHVAASAPGAARTALRSAWTREATLPGGDLTSWIGQAQRPDTDFTRFAQAVALRYPQLAPDLCHRLARAYGSRVDVVLAGPLKDNALGAQVAPGLFEAELNYLHEYEWARSAEDVLWRRSKLGLHLDATQRAAVADWCAAHWPGPATQSGATSKRATESTWN